MNVAGQNLASTVMVSSGWKWIAVLIGFGVLVLLYLLTYIWSKGWNPWTLVTGADGAASTSKLQWLLWLVAIIFSYTVLWVVRARGGDYAPDNTIPVNLLTVLGFSTGTAAAAKGITAGYVQTGKVTKLTSAQTQAAQSAGKGGILQDDSGTPELAKIQMMGFTFIAIGIFLATVIHQIVAKSVDTTLPDIDSSLLVLMGISQGGYLGKKLVTTGTPTLYPPSTPSGAPGATITLSGANFGTSPVSQLTMDGIPIATTSWTATTIVFNVPATNPKTNAGWTPNTEVQLAVAVAGQTSNPVPFTVTGPAPNV